MGAQFELRVSRRVVRAELLEEEAPRICRAFQDCLPLDSFAVHAKFAGDELIVMVPFVAGAENEVGSVAPGDIGYYPSRQTLCLFYGDVMPFASVTLFARVLSEDLPTARAAGQEVLAAGMAPVRVTAGEGTGRPAFAGQGERPGAWTGNGLAGRLAAATREVWRSEPTDVVRLRSYGRPPMGTMPCVLYANFDLFWAGENLQACRGLAQAGRLPSRQAGLVTAALLRRTASRLSKWDFADTVAVIEAVASDLEAPAGSAAGRDSLHAMIDGVQLYLDRVQSWVDAAIPWSEMDQSLRLVPPAPGGPARA
jgi:hypothetical protein